MLAHLLYTCFFLLFLLLFFMQLHWTCMEGTAAAHSSSSHNECTHSTVHSVCFTRKKELLIPAGTFPPKVIVKFYLAFLLLAHSLDGRVITLRGLFLLLWFVFLSFFFLPASLSFFGVKLIVQLGRYVPFESLFTRSSIYYTICAHESMQSTHLGLARRDRRCAQEDGQCDTNTHHLHYIWMEQLKGILRDIDLDFAFYQEILIWALYSITSPALPFRFGDASI